MFTEIVYATSTAVLFQVGKRKILTILKNKDYKKKKKRKIIKVFKNKDYKEKQKKDYKSFQKKSKKTKERL